MKTITVVVREVNRVTYEVEVEDDFNDFSNEEALQEALYGDGCAPPCVENEVESEEIVDAW